MDGVRGRGEMNMKRIRQRLRRLLGRNAAKLSPAAPPFDWVVLASQITSCPEFSQLEFHPLAGKIEGDRQYFFDGSFTTYPWSVDDMLHKLIEWTKGAGEPQEIVPFIEVVSKLPDDAVTFELGGGWAFYSVMVGTRRPKATMVIVEANPRLCEIARTNMERNDLTGRYRLYHAAVTEQDGETLRFLEAGYGSTISGDGQYSVKTVSVDGIIDELHLSHIHIVHMDVQGEELKVLRGMRRALGRRAVDHVFVGTHGRDVHIECERLLNDQGYRTVRSLNQGESASGDGILICVRREMGRSGAS